MGHHSAARARAGTVLLVLSLLTALLAVVAPPAAPATIVEFAPRFQTNANGAIALFGNTLLTCEASATCADAQVGVGRNLNNNAFRMVYVDVDSDASTFSSSTSDVILPPDARVLFAGLYWGAKGAGGTGGTAATTPLTQMKLRAPGDTGYRTVTSARQYGPTAGDRAYQQFADVTSIVAAAGPGTYTGADVAAGTGEDRYAGWSLAVAYSDPTAPLRNLTVFDGFTDVGQGETTTVNISGFLAPLRGAVDSSIGMVVYEGDASSSGDRVQLESTLLATPLSTATNFFRSTNERGGSNVTTRDPDYLNMTGFDIKDVGASGVVPNGARSATLQLSSTSERYLAGAVTTSINLYAPDLTTSTKSVTNLSGRERAVPGDELEYALTYANSGQDPAAAVIARDPLPAGVTYQPGSLTIDDGPGTGPVTDASGDDRGEYLAASRTVQVRLGTGATSTEGGVLGIPGGTSPSTTTVRFRAVVDVEAAGTSPSNQATLAYAAATTGVELAYVGNRATVPVDPLANLSVTKSATPDPVSAGDDVTSTIVVRNAGPSAAAGAVVTDELPADVTFVSSDPDTCTSAGTTLTCPLGTLPSGATRTVTVVARVAPGSTAASVADVASVDSAVVDPDMADNVATASVTTTHSADLSVTKTALTDPVVPGEQAEFEVTVRNAGPSTARDVVLRDQSLSDDLAIVSIDPTDDCGPSGAGVQCDLGSLAPGADRTYTVVGLVDPAATDSLTNTARVTSTTPDPDGSDTVALATIAVAPPVSDLAVAKSVAPASVVAGGHATYTIVATNEGPSTARTVEVTDTLPAGLTPTSVASDRGTVSTDGQGVLVSVPILPVGGTVTVTVSVDVDAGITPGTVVNGAGATSDSADDTPARDTAPLTVVGRADLSVSKSGTPSTVVGGDEVTYVLTGRNAGPSTARSVELVDTLPAGFTAPGPLPAGCTVAAGVLSCAVGDLEVGDDVARTVVLLAPDDVPDTVVNVVEISSATADPNAANDTASFAAGGTEVADLDLTKELDGEAVAGSDATFALHVTNQGPSASAVGTVVDTLPDGLTFVSGAGCSAAGQVVTCALDALAAGGTQTTEIVAAVDRALPTGTSLVNTATATSTTPDPSSANNTSTVPFESSARADLVVTKEVSQPSGPAGTGLLFTITVANAGPSVARDVTIVDSWPVDAFIGSDIPLPDGCGPKESDLECDVGDLAPGGDPYVLQFVAATAGDVATGTYVNVATASSATPDLDVANNRGEAPFTVTGYETDVQVVKHELPSITAGAEFAYQLTVSTPGPSNAHDVVLTDSLPSVMVPSSVTSTLGTCTLTGQTVTCDLGTVRQFDIDQVVVTVFGRTDPAADPATVTNTAEVSTSTLDVDPGNNASSVDTRIVRDAVLSVTKTADTDTFVAGGAVSWTIAVTNAGPSTARDVSVADVLPVGVTLDTEASDPACTADDDGARCTLGTLEPGESRNVRVAGTLDPAAPEGDAVNTVTVTSPDASDPVETSSTTAVTRAADLVLTKAPSTPTPGAGEQLTWTLTLTNDGPSVATDASIVDQLPAGVDLVSVTPADPTTCETAGREITCDAGDLDPGASTSALVTVAIPADALAGTVTNAATATSGTPDPDTGSNAAESPVEVTLVADVSILKTVRTVQVRAGAPVTYRFAVTNAGPSSAPDTRISDVIPDGLTFERGSGCAVETTEDGKPTLGCALGGIEQGATAFVDVTFTTRRDLARELVNTAYAGSTALDRRATDNDSTATAAVVAAPGETATPTPTASSSPEPSDTPTPSTSPDPTDQPTPPPDAEGPQPGLSATGATTVPLLAAAGALLLAGLSLRLAGRRRG